MKNNFYLILLLSCFRFAAQIPNPDFEEWGVFPASGPTGWNSFAQFHNQVSNGHSGNYAAEVHFYRDQANVLFNLPLTTGLTGKNFIPAKLKPTKLFGWFKINGGSGADTALFLIEFKKSGTLIGSGQFTAAGFYFDYTSFTADINYTSVAFPDSFRITLGFKTMLSEYANLEVDDLSLDQTVGLKLNEELPTDIELFPNPANDFVELRFTSVELINEFQSYAIYNNLGVLLREEEILNENHSCKISIDDLPNGVYSLRLNPSSASLRLRSVGARSSKMAVSKRFVIVR